MIGDRDLLLYNTQGWIPGPQEGEEEFLSRIAATRIQGGSSQNPYISAAQEKTKELFGFICPDLCPVYDDRNLSLWQGAALWVCSNEEGIEFPQVQLRKTFQKGRFLRYRTEEVLSHEIAHAARIKFQEPGFEEILAYHTSQRLFHRFLGPLFRSPRDGIYLLGSLILSVVAVWMDVKDPFFTYSLYIPFVVFMVLFLRLCLFQLVFTCCKKKIRCMVGEVDRALEVLFRLTDREIVLCALKSPLEISAYFQEKKGSSLRMRMIWLAYFCRMEQTAMM